MSFGEARHQKVTDCEAMFCLMCTPAATAVGRIAGCELWLCMTCIVPGLLKAEDEGIYSCQLPCFCHTLFPTVTWQECTCDRLVLGDPMSHTVTMRHVPESCDTLTHRPAISTTLGIQTCLVRQHDPRFQNDSPHVWTTTEWIRTNQKRLQRAHGMSL